MDCSVQRRFSACVRDGWSDLRKLEQTQSSSGRGATRQGSLGSPSVFPGQNRFGPLVPDGPSADFGFTEDDFFISNFIGTREAMSGRDKTGLDRDESFLRKV